MMCAQATKPVAGAEAKSLTMEKIDVRLKELSARYEETLKSARRNKTMDGILGENSPPSLLGPYGAKRPASTGPKHQRDEDISVGIRQHGLLIDNSVQDMQMSDEVEAS